MQEKSRGGLFGRSSKIRNSMISGLTGLFKRGIKLDSTTRRSITITLSKKYGLPIRFVGVGELMEVVGPFNAQGFASALLPEKPGELSAQQA